MLKDEYLKAVRKAGFQDVKILGETAFPMEFMANDPMVKGLVEHLRILPEKIGEVAESIRSIKVSGVKPVSITS
jgi:hypothetical protein